MSYEYDIFISYRRCGDWPVWVGDHFLRTLKHCLEVELGDVKIFFDRNIEAGKDWPIELGQSLAKSKILVPLLSRQYFSSKWCANEFAMMRKRESMFDIPSRENSSRLIVPAIIHDGKYLDEDVSRIQSINLSDYTNPHMPYESILRAEMHETITSWVADIENALDVAPEYNDSWLDFTVNGFLETYYKPQSKQLSVPRI